MVSAAAAPIEKKRLGHVNHVANEELSSPAAALKRNRRKISRLPYANLRVGLGDQALCRGDVRPPLQKLRRHDRWESPGDSPLSGSTGIENVDAGWPVKHRDGMFELRPLDAESDILRLRGFQLTFGLLHCLVRANAGFVQPPY
jgi:hypothetical protein